MKVYMVIEGYVYEGSRVVKVFTDKAKAEQYAEELKAEHSAEWDEPYDGEDYYVSIDEMEVE